MNKRGFAFPMPVIILLVISIVGFAAAGVIRAGDITGSGEYIERPVFKYVKCEAVGGYKYGAVQSLSQDGSWITPPSVSSSYDVILKSPDPAFAFTFGQQFNYYICNQKSLSTPSACRVYNNNAAVKFGDSYTISNVKGNEYVWVQFQTYTVPALVKGFSGATVQLGFVPYGLRQYDPFSGVSTINPNDCSVSFDDDTWQDRFIKTDSSKVALAASKVPNTLERTLDPEEARVFVTGYVTTAAPSFQLTYSGQSAWCKPEGSQAGVYKINSVTAGSGTYKVASVDWSDRLGTVTCCPGDKLPGKACSNDFKWISTETAECSAFRPCDGAQWSPYSSKTISRYSCVQSKCVLETKPVACANDGDCTSINGGLCDRNTWTCVNPNVNLVGQPIQTVPANGADCEAKGGVWKTENTKEGGFLGIGARDVVTNYCDLDANKFPWFKLALLTLGLAGAYLFRNQIWAGYKALIGRFGV